MNSKKTFKTLDEQMEILKSRGLVITDVEKTKNTNLLKENAPYAKAYIFFKSTVIINSYRTQAINRLW